MVSRVTYQNISPEVTRKPWRVLSPDAEGINMYSDLNTKYIHKFLSSVCSKSFQIFLKKSQSHAYSTYIFITCTSSFVLERQFK